jgi:fimbrial chaperone protein
MLHRRGAIVELTRGLLAASLCSASAMCRAASFEVAPVVHELAPEQQALAMTLANRGTATATAQVRVFRWAQIDGKETLSPAPQVIVSPAIFELEPGQSQLVRALFPPEPADQERSYRFLIDEIPDANAVEPLRFALRLSVPVFRLPALPAAAALSWRLDTASRSLVATNAGGRRERIREIVLTAEAGGARIEPAGDGGLYLLAGQQRRWSVPALAAAPRPGERWTLTAQTDGGRIEVPLVAAP